jgi:ATP-dependent DNA helicase RecQ
MGIHMSEALDALRTLTKNPAAEFHQGQLEAIEILVKDKARVIVVQRTGWGKSAVYFVATHLLRKQGMGPSLIVSPLLALMNNQINPATTMGLRAYTINSANDLAIDDLISLLNDDTIDLLLISPERLANPEFTDKIMPLIGRRPGLIVIDEVLYFGLGPRLSAGLSQAWSSNQAPSIGHTSAWNYGYSK